MKTELQTQAECGSVGFYPKNGVLGYGLVRLSAIWRGTTMLLKNEDMLYADWAKKVWRKVGT